MKTKKLAIALAMSTISLLTGCGSSGGSPAPVAGNIIGYTQQCTPTGCVQVPIYGGTGGCVPLSSPIYFAGSGQILGNVLAAGTIPNYGTYGSLGISTSPVSQVGGQVYTSPSGLQISVASSYAGAQTSVSGSLQLSQAAQYNISLAAQSGAYPSYNNASYTPWGNSSYYGGGYTSSSACVSGIALQLAPYTSVNGVYGYAYLYLNNTQHGYILQLY
ncbi:MAG: hypothetical protein ACJ763_20095 [Bdellovibrionia bacterium]